MRLVLAAILSLAPLAPALAAQERLACFIRLSRDGAMMHLAAYVESDRPLVGSYQLSVARRGLSGQSRNTQRGAFQAPAPDGTAILLGRVSVRLSGDDSLRADLTIRAGQQIICQAVL